MAGIGWNFSGFVQFWPWVLSMNGFMMMVNIMKWPL